MEKISEGVAVKRAFRNSDGDWEKIKKLQKEICNSAETLEQLVKDLVAEDKKLKALQLEAYKLAPAVDCLFYDSPMSPAKQTFHLKAYFKKMGWDGIRDVFVPTVGIDDFSKVIKDGCSWLVKFKSETIK